MTPRYPDLKHSVILCVLFLVFQIYVSVFMMTATSSKGAMILVSVIVPPLFILGITARKNNATLGRVLGWGASQKKTIIPLILMTVSLAFVISEVENVVIQYLLPKKLYESYLQQFMAIFFFENPLDLVLGLLSIALIGPFMEESVFRGVIFRGIASYRGVTYGVIASSVLFMAVHINPLQFPGALVLGLIYSTMISRGYLISDTFIAHSIHNTISLMFLMGAFKVAGMNPLASGGAAHVSFWIVAASLAVFAASFRLVLAWAPGAGREGGDTEPGSPMSNIMGNS